MVKTQVIVLCGSWDIKHEIRQFKCELEKNPANTVLIPNFPITKPNLPAKKVLMKEHFERIDVADQVIIVVKDRVGVNTAMEFGYAIGGNKEIYAHRLDKSVVLVDMADEFVGIDEWEG